MRVTFGLTLAGIVAVSSTALAGRPLESSYVRVKPFLDRGSLMVSSRADRLRTSTTNGYKIINVATGEHGGAGTSVKQNGKGGYNYKLQPGAYYVINKAGKKVRSFVLSKKAAAGKSVWEVPASAVLTTETKKAATPAKASTGGRHGKLGELLTAGSAFVAASGLLAATTMARQPAGPAIGALAVGAMPGLALRTALRDRPEPFIHRNVQSLLQKGRLVNFNNGRALRTSTTNGYKIIKVATGEHGGEGMTVKKNYKGGYNYSLRPGTYYVVNKQGEKVRSFVLNRSSRGVWEANSHALNTPGK